MLPETHQQWINQYFELKQAQQKIKQQMDILKKLLTDQYPDGQDFGDHKLSYMKGRINWTKLAQKHTPETCPEIYTQQIDPKLAEQHLPAIELDMYRNAPTTILR